jgi:endonuclease/exonuclease/phosphatase (EEP) superfamily protein YafD
LWENRVKRAVYYSRFSVIGHFMNPPASTRPSKSTRIVQGLAVSCLLVCFLGIAASPLGVWSSWIERLTHFRFYWIGLLTALCLWWGLRKYWRWLTGSMVLLAWGIAGVLPYYQTPQASPTASGPALTLISYNLLSRNQKRQEVLAWLESQTADVILLTEFSRHWERAFIDRAKAWPHRLEFPRGGAAGICLLSKWPMSAAEPAGVAPEEMHPWILTTIESPAGPVRVLGMHPRTPRGGYRFDQRNVQLARAAEIAGSSTLPFVLLGDLNCSPFSPWFSRLTARGNLRDSALGRGLPPTWHSEIWWLPIDHVLISPHWQVQERRTFTGDLGSDHFPLIAVLTKTVF